MERVTTFVEEGGRFAGGHPGCDETHDDADDGADDDADDGTGETPGS